MEEDWGTSANAPTFSLFGNTSTPAEQAKLDTFVNPVIYGRWSKADRRLYQKLKHQMIAEKLKKDELNTIDELSRVLDLLNFSKSKTDGVDSDLDDLINQVKSLKVTKENEKAKA